MKKGEIVAVRRSDGAKALFASEKDGLIYVTVDGGEPLPFESLLAHAVADDWQKQPTLSVEFAADGAAGTVRYFEDTKEVEVEHPTAKVSQDVAGYLTKQREFRIPESDDIDDFRVDKAKPTDSLMYMELALCTLYAEIGAWVDWDTEERREEAA